MWFSVGVDRVGRAVEIDMVRGFLLRVVTGLVWIQIGWFGGGVVIDDCGAVEVGVAGVVVC